MLRVTVASTGWVAVANSGIEPTLVPAFVFSLTNVGNQPATALQVNALFYLSGPKLTNWAAFSSAVGWHGLPPGATSHSVVLRGGCGIHGVPELLASLR